MDVAIHLCGPLQEAPQTGSLRPQKFPEFQESNLGHFDAGVGLDPPEQIGTAPRSNPVATGGVPKKAQDRAHLFQYSAGETGQAPSLQTHFLFGNLDAGAGVFPLHLERAFAARLVERDGEVLHWRRSFRNSHRDAHQIFLLAGIVRSPLARLLADDQ